MDKQNFRVNFEKISKELTVAEEADSKYKRENDAKFRAVAQKVNYEEFREIVMASHLKALDKGDKLDGKLKQPWNTGTHSQVLLTFHSTKKGVEGERVTATNFQRLWRGRDGAERHQMLMSLAHNTLLQALDQHSHLLGEVLCCMAEHLSPENSKELAGMLEVLSALSRVHMLLAFLSKREKEVVATMVRKLCLENATLLDTPFNSLLNEP